MAIPTDIALRIMSEASGIDKLPSNITMTAMLNIIDLAFTYGQKTPIECSHDFNYGYHKTYPSCVICGKTVSELQ